MNSSDPHLWTPYPAVTCLSPMHALAAIEFVSMILSLAMNITVFYVLMFKSDTDNEAQYSFVKCLTVADILICGICQPFFITIVLRLESRTTLLMARLQQFTFFLTTVACSSSTASLTIVCVQRYIQIAYPLKYEMILTPKRIRILLVYVWVSSVVSCMLLWIKGANSAAFYGFVLAAMLTVLIMLIFIYMHTLRIISNLIQPMVCVDMPANVGSWKKAIRTSTISLICFVACWFPFAILGLDFYIKHPTKAWHTTAGTYTCDSATKTNAYVFMYSIFLAHCSSFINPVIITLRNSHIKAALVNLITKKWRTVGNQPDTTRTEAGLGGYLTSNNNGISVVELSYNSSFKSRTSTVTETILHS